MFCQCRHSGHRLPNLTLSLKSKRNSHYPDGENVHALGNLSHRGGSTGTGTSTHTRSDKQHLRTVIKRFVDTVS